MTKRMAIFRSKGRRSQKKVFRAKGRKGTTKSFSKRKGSAIKNMMFDIKKLKKTIETKSVVIQIARGNEYGHNALQMVNSNFLGTVSGIEDLCV